MLSKEDERYAAASSSRGRKESHEPMQAAILVLTTQPSVCVHGVESARGREPSLAGCPQSDIGQASHIDCVSLSKDR